MTTKKHTRTAPATDDTPRDTSHAQDHAPNPDTATATADDDGPTNAREYFKAVARPMNVAATIEDVCGLLEHFGLLPMPQGFARRKGK